MIKIEPCMKQTCMKLTCMKQMCIKQIQTLFTQLITVIVIILPLSSKAVEIKPNPFIPIQTEFPVKNNAALQKTIRSNEVRNYDISGKLVISGSTDTPIFKPLIEGFQEQYPQISVSYLEYETTPLYNGIVEQNIVPTPDVVISSATDLQFKLANDGYALPYNSPYLDRLPSWAKWRNEIFGFTLEPIVFVYNSDLLAEDNVPHSRLALIELLEKQNSDPQLSLDQTLQVSTYDISKSGAGYLLASQDALISNNFWRLANAIGPQSTRLMSNSTTMLEALAEGKLTLAYNVLGAYAYAKAVTHPNLKVLIPDDYVLVSPRTALINRHSEHLDIAKLFIDFLLSTKGQTIAANHPGLGSILPNIEGTWSVDNIEKNAKGVIKYLEINPTLLVGLDQRRRSQFINTWLSLVMDGGHAKQE